MALADVLERLGPSQKLLAFVALPLGILVAYLFLSRSLPGKSPPLVKGDWPLIGPVKFWTRRWDFFQEAAARSLNGHFSFHVGQHKVVGVMGDDARKVFIESKQLDMSTGYATLFAGSPTVPSADDTEQEETEDLLFAKRLGALLKSENLVKGLRPLMMDTKARLDELAKDPTGLTDPFESMYGIVFQLTMRTLAANDIANDRVLLEQTLNMYEQVEAASSPQLIIFPWFPFPGKLKRLWYGGKLYMVFKKIIDERAKTGHREDDPLQFLIDKGDSITEILTFVIGALYAGQLNSGINAAWVTVYLANDPHWRGKVWEEVKAMAEKYDNDTSKSIAERLESVPLEAWEAELPTVEFCLRESIRLNTTGSMFRLNNSTKAVNLSEDTEIPAGSFAAYPIADIHLNPEVYPDPRKWDPSRYFPDRAEDQKRKHSYLGWGGGRHPCLGMRFAKLEQNIILAFFMAYFDIELTDKDGNPGVQLPQSNVNEISASKPQERVYVKYKARG